MFDGIDPPAERLDKDYVQQPGNSRKCVECGKWHDMIIENTRTGERIEEIEKCYDCIMSKCFFKPMTDIVNYGLEENTIPIDKNWKEFWKTTENY